MNANAASDEQAVQDEQDEQDEARVEAFIIAGMMSVAGLPNRFIVRAVELSGESEPVLELMRMWRDEEDESERDATIADIQELIDDCLVTGKIVTPCIRFDDLDRISDNVLGFKDNLRILVDEYGGISKLAEATGIPQPSLSRFFGSPAIPRRATLNKIARALNLTHLPLAISPELAV
jgi:DNA-binding phage protein